MVEDGGDGDLVEEPTFFSEFNPPQPPPPVPLKPDVELTCDGFGFMKPNKMESVRKRPPNLDGDEEETQNESENVKSTESSSPLAVRRFTWKTKNRMTVQVISYGATITCIKVPDRKGVPEDVVMGFETMEEYQQERNQYLGATIGRCAQRIGNGTMHVAPSGKTIVLSTNLGEHHYHGGAIGFDKVNWDSYVEGTKVTLSHVSPEGHEGYPGSVLTQVVFDVTGDNTLKIVMKCTCSDSTVINLTNNSYFNLAGHHAGPVELYQHYLTINADKFTPTDDDLLPTGQKSVVGGTAYDFRFPRLLSEMIPRVPRGGYDLNFIVTRGIQQELTFVSRALHPKSGRVLEIYSNQPAVQFYTGNLLPNPDEIRKEEGEEDEAQGVSHTDDQVKGIIQTEAIENSEEGTQKKGEEGILRLNYDPLIGKNGAVYKRHGAFCLMTQNFPNAIHWKNFPSVILRPGQVYEHIIHYKFGLQLGNYV